MRAKSKASFATGKGLACTARATVAADVQCMGTDNVKEPGGDICLAMSETQTH